MAELEALYGLDLEDRNYLASLGRGRDRYATNINQPHLKENLRPNIISRPPGCCPEEVERLEQEVRELDEKERKIRDMKAGRGSGTLQSRIYNGRPPPRDNIEGNPALPRFTPVTLIKRGPVTTRSRS